jgi:hypothetical protein
MLAVMAVSGAGGGAGGATVLLLNGVVLGVARWRRRWRRWRSHRRCNRTVSTRHSVVKLLFPLQMVKMAPTNLATGAEVVEVAVDTMVAMAAKAQVVILVAKQDLFGSSYSNIGITSDPTNRLPAYQASGAAYYNTERGAGGQPRSQGTVGYAVLEFDVHWIFCQRVRYLATNRHSLYQIQ